MMTSTKNKYQKIGDDIELALPTAENEVELPPMNVGSILNPLAFNIPIENSNFVLKILFKEQSYIITTLTSNSTISELKTTVESIIHMPIVRQRFIFAGKQLKPDSSTLNSFNIQSNSTLHLFPLPEAQPAIPVASQVNGTNVAYNPLAPVNATPVNNYQNMHMPVHFNGAVVESGREVKLWCIILLFLSFMTLFNNFSYFSSTGRLGSGTLDTLVTLADTLCSVGGLIVANMGIKSLRTMDIAHIKKYVKCLVCLAVASVVMRLAWVADVILQVEKMVRNSHNDNSSTTPPPTTNPTNDPKYTDDLVTTGTDQTKLNKQLVVNLALQASVIAAICIFSWITCVYRARSLQLAVERFNDVPAQVQQV